MRAVAATLVVSTLAFGPSPALAEVPAPLDRLTPAEGRYFDDPIALSADGKTVASISTDGTSAGSLLIWRPGAKEAPLELALEGEPSSIAALAFVGADRVLVVQKSGDRQQAMIASLSEGKGGRRLVADKRRLGPADAIEVTEAEGKPAITLYSRAAKKGGSEHSLQRLAPDGRVLAKRVIVEDGEGLVRTKAGALRPLWWSSGHSVLSAQKLGAYDKAHDVQRPNRFVRLDPFTDKILVEQEIDDVLGFTRAGLAHKAVPDREAFARLADDRKEVLVTDGTRERAMPLARAIDVYDPDSLRSLELDAQRLLVGYKVDPNNVAAVNRRGTDPDDLDIYLVDRASLTGKEVTAPRVLVLPGQGRPAAFTATPGHLLVLRKGKGFDRGGVALELYALP